MAAKPVPKKKKVSPGAKAFGAATAIFVPPELQHETGPSKKKPPPRRSVVIKEPKPKPETVAQKRKREAQETQARERLRLGLKIRTPTGPNRLDAVPPPPPSKTVSIFGGHARMSRFAHDIGLGLGRAAVEGATSAAHGLEGWAGDVAAVPGNVLRSALDQSPAGPRSPVPQSLQRASRVAGQAEPLVRPIGATSEFLGSEKGQEEIWGKSLVNLALHGDLPSGWGEAGGLSLGVLGILPLGKFSQLSKAARLARAAGKIGGPMEDTPARTAALAALSQRFGEEQARNVILLTDQRARNAAKAGEVATPAQWYEKNQVKATKFEDFTPSEGTQFQTGAGPRQGLVEGTPSSTTETPVFYSPLQRKVEVDIPAGGMTKAETLKALAPPKKPGPTSVKEAEWRDAGMQDFLDQYGLNEVIPKQAIQSHLATSLNAYDLDEVILASNSEEFRAKWGERSFGALTVRDESKGAPYFELVMSLRTPMRTRIAKSIMGGHPRVNAPYAGKGLAHWGRSDVLAHVRFHVITDSEGRRALLVDEIQSDWKSEDRLFNKLGGEAGIAQRTEEINRELEVMRREAEGVDEVTLMEIEDQMNDLEAERSNLAKLRKHAGPPPLGEKQMEAIIRRTIRYAHDANVDRIIVVRGDVQAIRNTAYAKTPLGREVRLFDPNLPLEEGLYQAQKWGEDFRGMSHDEIKAWANDPANRESGTAKTFFRLYGSDAEKGQIPAMFEKEMGEQGAVVEGVFDGGYADGTGNLKREAHVPMDGFVIEMTDAAKARAAEPMSYYQTAMNPADLPRGAAELLADGTRVIHLFEGADISTIIHELAHVSYADLNAVDKAILGRHFGNLEDAANVTAHEAYARALERYVYEGQAMTSELDGVFAKLKTWMEAVYIHVNRIGAHVDPEVKQVFDRMFVQHETPAEQLVRLLKTAPKVRKAQRLGYSLERGKRIEEMFDQWPEEATPDEVFQAMNALKGELPKEPFTGLDELTPEAVASLARSIRISPKVRRYEKVRAFKALMNATEGAVPTDSELRLMNKIFGGEVRFKKALGGVEKVFVEVFNIPRSIAASFDLSAPLRQGFVAGTRHPVIFAKAFKPMFESLFSEERAAAIAEEIAQRANYVHYGRGDLAIETTASSAELAMREEQFYSSYAERFIPPVKWSGRAYEAFLHRLRADIFDLTMEAARAKKVNVESDEFVEGLGKMVNQMTGRGVLPETHLFPFETAAPLFNTFLFSPRLLASRVNMISPVYYFRIYKHDPFLFAEATKNLMTTVLATGVVLAAASTLPGVSVGMDPTSANFGKIRIGNTRIDIMAGFGPLLVFLSREILGKSTSSTTGKTQALSGGFGKSTRKDILYRFLESKAAPTAGIGLDILRGSTFIGDPVTVQGELINSTAPMMLRDVLEVWREPKDPVDAAIAAGFALALGTFGVGFSSYGPKAPKSKSSGSGEGGPTWDSGNVGEGPTWDSGPTDAGPVWTP